MIYMVILKENYHKLCLYNINFGKNLVLFKLILNEYKKQIYIWFKHDSIYLFR